MKITFVTPALTQNGGSRVIGIYAQQLLGLGHDVNVVSFLPKELRRRAKFKKWLFEKKSMKADPNHAVLFKNFGSRLIQIPHEASHDYARIPDADVVIATWWRTAFSVAAFPPEKGAKAYFVQGHEVHDYLPWELSRGSYYLPLKKITIASWLVDTMATVYGDKDTVKVANAVDGAQFDAPVRTRNARPRVGLLYAGAWIKGTDVSLRAIEIARARFPDLEVLVFGNKDPEPHLPLPAGCKFHKLPLQDEIPKLYAACDAWLFGSRSEGFGLPILEAMACRTPVIACRAGAAADLIVDRVNGHLVDVDDAEAMGARLIETLSLDAQTWGAMSQAAHEKAHSYSWEDAAKEFEAALLKIAGRA